MPNELPPLLQAHPARKDIMTDREWLTTQQAMEYLQISYPTLLKLINEGKLHAARPAYRWRISAESVQKLLKGYKQ